MSPSVESGRCPAWCLGEHREDIEHHAARVPVGELVAELIRYPDDQQVYRSLLEPDEGGGYLLVPMSVVPLIATVALRLSARANSAVTVPGLRSWNGSGRSTP